MYFMAQPDSVYLCMSVSHPKKSKIVPELDVIYFPFKNISKKYISLELKVVI